MGYVLAAVIYVPESTSQANEVLYTGSFLFARLAEHHTVLRVRLVRCRPTKARLVCVLRQPLSSQSRQSSPTFHRSHLPVRLPASFPTMIRILLPVDGHYNTEIPGKAFVHLHLSEGKRKIILTIVQKFLANFLQYTGGLGVQHQRIPSRFRLTRHPLRRDGGGPAVCPPI